MRGAGHALHRHQGNPWRVHPEEKRELVERVSEAVIAVEGEALRAATVTAITETPSGEWALGGQIFTADKVKAMRSAGATL
jgi:4-oxalocrotonate tautomerase